ncbi:MAG TPA: hypothetical protein PLD27_00680 [bacterium]|nr:hypothetical protein [bacterium]HOL46932.1 hypothetical protein [bacterium]HPQ18306.1 hypothetical protein [bacterium]
MKKNFFIIICSCAFFLYFFNCSSKKEKKVGEYKDTPIKSDTEIAYDVVKNYFLNFQNKNVDGILANYSKNKNNNLFSKEYFTEIFNNTEKINIELANEKINTKENNEIEINVDVKITLTFTNEISKTNIYKEQFFLIKEDNWKIYSRNYL